MPDVLNPRVVAGFKLFLWLSSLASVVLGGLVLAGWLTGNERLVTVAPGLAAMSPVTACAFVLGGVSLAARRRALPALANASALLLLVLVAIVLAGYLTVGRDVLNPLVGNRLPTGTLGFTAPATACCFALLGIALLLAQSVPISGLPANTWALRQRVGVTCAASGMLISGLALLGYAYGAEGLYATSFYRSMAPHTAAGLFVLFLACLVQDPQRGWAAIVAAGTPNGRVVRWQLLLTTLLPFLAGLLMLWAIRAGAIAASLGVAILVAVTTVPLVLRILLDGRMLDRLDMRRQAAVEAQQRLHEALEKQIQERTEALALSEARLRTYFDHAPEGLAAFRLTDEGMFVYDAINPAFRAMYGMGERDFTGLLPGQSAGAAVVEELQRQFRDCLRSGTVLHHTEQRIVEGQLRTINAMVAPAPAALRAAAGLVVVSTRDVTEAMSRDEQLRQAQKMEAIGQLTGGLAHDFNNLLTGIAGSLELMATRLSQGRTNDLDRYIVAAQGAAKRAAALTHRLLAFSRRQTLDPRPTDINQLVAGMEELIRRSVGPAISVEVVAAGGLWATLIDPNQLENALLNLCINARDAMPDGGKLTIETGNKWLDDRAASARDMAAGQYVTLCVSDTGAGMAPEVVARAFDPFFTTKPTGSGTGLGLSMVYGFARQSGGQARIYSEPGRGAMICLYLPRHYGAVEDPPPPSPAPAQAPPARLDETVLVVDDEPAVRMLVTEVLEELGYTAMEAADGSSGLKVLQSSARIDLLVTDVGLPGDLNGRQMADAARAVRPGLRVLFITGYAENAVLNHGHLDPGMHVMTKPFAMDVLARRIKELVAGA